MARAYILLCGERGTSRWTSVGMESFLRPLAPLFCELSTPKRDRPSLTCGGLLLISSHT